MSLKRYCWTALGVYALLSVLDLMLTFSLLESNGAAYESNPVAAACLERHGWSGLGLFKLGGVVLFSGAVFLLIRRRPPVAAAVATLGCAVLCAVTLYSRGLIRESEQEAAAQEAAARPIAESTRPVFASHRRLPAKPGWAAAE